MNQRQSILPNRVIIVVIRIFYDVPELITEAEENLGQRERVPPLLTIDTSCPPGLMIKVPSGLRQPLLDNQ